MKCTICKGIVRKTQLVWRADSGKMLRSRACSKCIRDQGYTFVLSLPKRTVVVQSPAREERELLKALETWLTGQIKAYANPMGVTDVVHGRIEAYEAVLERIKQGAV